MFKALAILLDRHMALTDHEIAGILEMPLDITRAHLRILCRRGFAFGRDCYMPGGHEENIYWHTVNPGTMETRTSICLITAAVILRLRGKLRGKLLKSA